MDDFGTGYSSLTYLKKLPIDIVKMDHEFIKNFEYESDAQYIIQSVIQLAHALNIMVVAEGIETEKQLNLLKKYGCDIGQGYLFCKPVAAEELEKMLASGWRYESGCI
jgi:EAL domain-containing protein (putative c-di-GMP-specific phosphodiesterase class I)